MRDPRIRLFSIVALSVGAFAGIWGAVAAFGWWLVFTPSFRSIRHPAVTATMVATVGIVAAAAELTAGNGLSYLVRMTVVILIATWAFDDWSSGEMLATSVWLFGMKWGFDLGLAGEMSVQAFRELAADIGRMRIADRIRGRRSLLRRVSAAPGALIVSQLRTAADQADLLVVRGYRGGGSVCLRFETPRREILAGSLAIVIGSLAFIPLGDIIYTLTVNF